jgi:hypothetical protein
MQINPVKTGIFNHLLGGEIHLENGRFGDLVIGEAQSYQNTGIATGQNELGERLTSQLITIDGVDSCFVVIFLGSS